MAWEEEELLGAKGAGLRGGILMEGGFWWEMGMEEREGGREEVEEDEDEEKISKHCQGCRRQ